MNISGVVSVVYIFLKNQSGTKIMPDKTKVGVLYIKAFGFT